MAKNKATDVADYLVMALEDLHDNKLSGEELKNAIARANATSNVAREWTALQKTAIDAARLQRETGFVPIAFDGGVKRIA